MCEDCNDRDATIRLTTIVNGEKVEKNLCASCMAKIKQQFPTLELWGFAGLLSGFLDAVKAEKPEPLPDITCNRCHTTYAGFVKSGMLGCADCYHSFREPLEALLKGIHVRRATRARTGALPGDVPLKLTIDRMRQQLATAIETEEYEKAAGSGIRSGALSAQLQSQAERRRVNVANKSPELDVVLSCRVRLARNYQDIPSPRR
jgi:protein arginine kinase activator